MKTRKQILIEDHNSALTQLIENEINLISLEKRASKLEPGKDFDEVQAQVTVRKKNIENVQGVIDVIDELIGKEK